MFELLAKQFRYYELWTYTTPLDIRQLDVEETWDKQKMNES